MFHAHHNRSDTTWFDNPSKDNDRVDIDDSYTYRSSTVLYNDPLIYDSQVDIDDSRNWIDAFAR
jgi:hypothetical protein